MNELSAGRLIWIIENWFSIQTKEKTGYFRTEPFVLRPYQKRILREIFQYPEKSVLIEKTRQMGLSWLMAAYFAVLLLFSRNEQLLILGKKEDLIDNTDLDSNTLMGKIKFILANIRNKNLEHYAAKAIEAKYLFIRNRYLNNVCNGESSSPSAGRGGTYSRVWWDETAFTPNDKAIFSSISPNTGNIFMISTPHGKLNMFYRVKKDIESEVLSTRWHKIRVHWTEYFDKEWYERKKKDIGGDQVMIASELDIDYEFSGGNRILYNFDEKNFTPDAAWNPALMGASVLSFDYGISDLSSGVFMQYQWTGEPEFRIVDSFRLKNIPFKTIYRALTERNIYILEEIRAKTDPEYYVSFERFFTNHLTRNYLLGNITGDPSAVARSIKDGKGIADLFTDNGFIYWVFPISDKEEDILTQIRGWKQNIFINDALAEIREMVEGWMYDTNADGLPIRVGHNIHSHLGDAVKYGFNFYINRIFNAGIE